MKDSSQSNFDFDFEVLFLNFEVLSLSISKLHRHYRLHQRERAPSSTKIDAHTGNVSDLAFSHPNKQLCVITCGEDKTIKFTFSTGTDGKIKAWLYDNLGSRADYDAPGHSCTTMAYSADGTRLFSCGTSKEGESYIVEWNESEGAVKRTYHGLGKRSVGVVQFDTTKDRFLAAGDEFVIKFWDMDNVNLLTTTDAEGGLPASPCIRFNKEGTLLAVSTSENGVKILANSDSVRLLRSIESRAHASRMASESAAKAPIIGTFCASSSAARTNVGVADRNAPAIPMITLVSKDTCQVDTGVLLSQKLHDQILWSSQSNAIKTAERQGSNTNDCVAVVPWVASQIPLTSGADVPRTEVSELMETEDMGEATMDVKESKPGQGYEFNEMSEGIHQWQQQHCMIPQLPENTTTPIVWYR
ncbi:hypothetical protein TEA_012846 [Camellia sinensis var. sinensis]|uniref:Uncharacterized protein n=1 Tax=Camellia sinensis var. sinensis TaxID=542762 RepID=A0A4S4ERQ6_CAMSN|nr:hypothetical protein TEA_012846 [Camellia sinensis var. sinensis]